jgi:hypothetical protein
MRQPRWWIGAAVSLAVAWLLGTGALHAARENALLADFDRWPRMPGTLKSLEIRDSTYRLWTVYVPAPAYEYAVNGRTHTGERYEFTNNHYHDRDELRRDVERTLFDGRAVQWRRETRAGGDVLVLAETGTAVRVSHSPSQPEVSVLLQRPPLGQFPGWAVVVVLTLLAAVFAFAALVFARMAMVGEEAAVEDAGQPPRALLDAYAALIERALDAAAEHAAAAPGRAAQLASLLDALRRERDAARAGTRRALPGPYALPGVPDDIRATPGGGRLAAALDAVEAFARKHLVEENPP